jgi:hypothetical protein
MGAPAMSGSRDAIFGALRRQLKRDAPSAAEKAGARARGWISRSRT